jgi:hypothetical protein
MFAASSLKIEYLLRPARALPSFEVALGLNSTATGCNPMQPNGTKIEKTALRLHPSEFRHQRPDHARWPIAFPTPEARPGKIQAWRPIAREMVYESALYHLQQSAYMEQKRKLASFGRFFFQSQSRPNKHSFAQSAPPSYSKDWPTSS